jgi:thioredoxin-like negative regulator of GroEL
LDLELRGLDGQVFNLAKFRGQPVLLAFWAPWSDRSREQLEQVQQLQADAANSKLRLVSVCIDGTAATVKAIAGERGYRGEQAYLDTAQRGPVVEKLQIETLPAVLLLDDKGRVMGRDLEGDRLRATVRRVMKVN